MAEIKNEDAPNAYERLVKECLEKGFKSGWVWHRMKEKFGEDIANGLYDKADIAGHDWDDVWCEDRPDGSDELEHDIEIKHKRITELEARLDVQDMQETYDEDMPYFTDWFGDMGCV